MKLIYRDFLKEFTQVWQRRIFQNFLIPAKSSQPTRNKTLLTIQALMQRHKIYSEQPENKMTLRRRRKLDCDTKRVMAD